MTEEYKPIIVVKRIKKSSGAHHGGAWKIAYADFVTAMMAFFLLMWLLGSTTRGELSGIAEYFQTPLRVALAGGSGSGDSSSILKGGGKDLTRTEGQVQRAQQPTEKRTINLQAARAELERVETMRLGELKVRLDNAIEGNAALRPYRKQIEVDITPDGLRVQIVDEQNRPMFDSGSAALNGYTREILRELGKLMNDVPNRISLSGHTDSQAYAAGDTIDVLVVRTGGSGTLTNTTFRVELDPFVGSKGSAGLNAPGGTGGIIVDNDVDGGGSQVYYSTRTSPGNAVQASQAGLN